MNIFKQKTIKKANEVLRNEQDVNIENYHEVQRTISQPIKQKKSEHRLDEFQNEQIFLNIFVFFFFVFFFDKNSKKVVRP